MIKHALIALLSLSLSLHLTAQQGDREGHEMAPPPKEWSIPAPVVPPSEALESFQLKDGFRLELVASEPDIHDPVCLTFDGNGRMWVCEMQSYMPDIDGNNEDNPNSRIVILEDTDGDGQVDKKKVFLDNIVLPRAIAMAEGGILWGDQDKLYFTERLKGDKAGETTVIDPDWAPGGNVEHKANGLLYAMDNWYYNAKSDKRYRQVNGEWVIDATEFRGQWGLAQDDWGRIVTNTNSNLISMEELYPGYTLRNPHHEFSLPTARVEENAVYPIRVTAGVNRGYQEGLLDENGFLTKATATCGLTIYRGDNFPAEYQGNAFIPEPAGLLVKRAVLEEKDGEFTVEAAYADREFLASTDERNRFVNSYTAPDGTLYLVDFYRGIVQHKTYVTTYLRNQILERGLDKPIGLGRIYRVVWEGKKPSAAPEMMEQSTAELVAHLSHANGWWRDTAQRLIVQSGDLSVVPALQKLAASAEDGRTRAHAVWTLEGLGALTPQDVAISNRTPIKVAVQKIRAAEVFAGTEQEADAVTAIASALTLDNVEVDRQLAGALGLFRLEGKDAATDALVQLLQRRGEDKHSVNLAMSGLDGAELEMAAVALEHDLPLLDELIPAVVAWGDAQVAEDLFDLLNSDSVDDRKREKLIGSMARTAVATRNKSVSALLLAHAAEKDARKAILNGMVSGSKTKGFKPISMSRPEVMAANDSTWESVEKLFDFSGKKPENFLKTDAHKRLYEIGRVEYAKLCIACHQPHGKGMDKMAPPLVDSEWVTGPENRLIALTMDGMMGPVTVNGILYQAPDIQPVMPGMRANPEIDDEKLAAILTYVRNTWGNGARPVEPETVKKWRDEQPPRAPFTEAELLEIE